MGARGPKPKVPIESIVDAYTYAASRGIPTTRYIADRYGLTIQNTTSRVHRARRAGLIATAPNQTMGARRHRRAVDVARALGVSYEALVEAVMTHANGDLRVGKAWTRMPSP